MLAGGAPYPTIPSVLVHSSTNVTKRYPSIDMESPRPLALEADMPMRVEFVLRIASVSGRPA